MFNAVRLDIVVNKVFWNKESNRTFATKKSVNVQAEKNLKIKKIKKS